jgi:hypothetical protein
MARAEKLPHCRGFRNSFARVFSLTLAVTALAKGAAFLPGYSIDDYSRMVHGAQSVTQLVVEKGEKGRFGSAFLSWCLHLVQLDPVGARVFFVACSIVVSAFFAALVVRFWGLDRNGWLAPAMACLVANHPYTAEIYTFRAAIGIAVFPLALLSLLLIPRRWSPRLLAVGSALFAAALSIYQLVLHSGLMIVSVGAALWLARYLTLGGARGWPRRIVSLLSIQRLARHRNTSLLVCLVLGTVLYAVLSAILAAGLHMDLSSRTSLLPIPQWSERAHTVAAELESRFWGPDPILAPLTQRMLLLVLAGSLAGLLARTRGWLRPRTPLLALSVLALLLASLVWTLGTLLVLAEFWPAPRIMAQVGIFWAGVLALSHQYLGRRARPALAALAVLAVLSFLGSNLRVLDEQRRLNLRDADTANRIIARMEAMPGFSEVRFVAVDGAAWSYPLRFGTVDHDLNVSAFGAAWAKVSILAEISGYDLELAVDEDQIQTAALYCHGLDPWPGPRSVTIQGTMAIVCLGPR